MKICTKCLLPRSLAAFSARKASPDGLSPKCKQCAKAYDKLWSAANPDKTRANQVRWRSANPDKKRAQDATWRAANQEKVKASQVAWRKANPGKASARASDWNKSNPEKRKTISAKYSAANPEKSAASVRLRNARKLHATPSWADLARIKCYYAVAAMLNREGLQKWEVDHIVPLRGKNVCGLHISHNLQLLTARENQSKGNKHPDGYSPA